MEGCGEGLLVTILNSTKERIERDTVIFVRVKTGDEENVVHRGVERRR